MAARVVAETPVRGAMSIRLPVDRAKVGALNLFSDTANAFDNTSVERAIVLAAFARWPPMPRRKAKTRPRCDGGW